MNMFSSSSIWSRVAAVTLIQAAILGTMVWDRVSLLKNGREIVLDVVPVDPRSLFRGDYVILNYAISRLEPALAEGVKGADKLFVTIGKQTDGSWKAVAANRTQPQTTGEDQIALAARPLSRWSWMSGPNPSFVRYGIESYFVPEGTGKAIEKAVGEKRIKAVIRVGRDGTAAIAGLMVDGKLVHTEPTL